MLSEDIAYKTYNRSNDIHGTVLYPAVMVAPVQKIILASIMDCKRENRIVDPFHGSGIALYEAAELSDRAIISGCDINPLANLVTRVKLQGVTEYIERDIQQLSSNISQNQNPSSYTFPRIEKWFRTDVIVDLSRIRLAIISISNQQNRLFFWYMLIDLIRRYSNTRSSTYKLHTKESVKIVNLENHIIEEYLTAVNEHYHLFMKNHHGFTLFKGDSLAYLKSMQDEFFDICITSPPYGDNATTVPYGQFSMLALQWIDARDLVLDGWEMDNYSKIDSMSLGGSFHSSSSEPTIPDEIKPYLQQITENKQKKVERFFKGYVDILDQISRTTRKYVVMTLGNRTVDGIKISLSNITVNHLCSRGFILKDILEREIQSKRTPKKVSRVRQQPVSSMNEEYVIIMEKHNPR